jgi:hypothetical protein
MARTAITATAIPATGLNLTDATYATLGTGAGNGVSIVYDGNTRIVLKNDTGGAATFTIKVPTPASYTDIGVTFPDMSVSVANGKTYEFKPAAVWRQSDGSIYIDCNVAGKALVTS